MANRKPTPKSQREISISQQEPYNQGGPGFQPVGNPNDLGPDYTNRGNQLSFKGDTTKPFTLGIQDIDEAIYYYFNEVIKPYVIQNGQRIAVPVIYGNPEKWKSIQKDGYYRDKNGAIMSPLLVFKRDNLTKNRSIGNKLDANQPHLYSSLIKPYSKRNFYTPFDVLNNIKPETEQYAVVIPDYVTITYSCVIYTYYVEQMNKIVEAINYASDSYWGDPSRFKFNARIDSFATVVEVVDGKDRSVKSNFDIKLNGYLIPDIVQKDMSAIKKIPVVTKTVFGIETTSNINQVPPPSKNTN
jgi:hypothetical protein